MKKLVFIEENMPTDRSAISAAEKESGLSFPTAYRDFLLSGNGGLSEECVFDIPGRGQSSLIFFGLNTGSEFNDAFANFIAYKNRIPSSAFPIGADPGGNLVCLLCDGPETGAVFFWDHERVDIKASISDMYRLATGFEEFVDTLQYENNESW